MSSFFDVHLFLGFALDPPFERALKTVNPHLVQMITSGDLYLQKMTYQGEEYLGKGSSKITTLTELEQRKTHIISLLKKLVPEHTYPADSFNLIPVHDTK